MKRKRLSNRKSKKMFIKSSMKSHRKNKLSTFMRGGIRL